jgi:D-alanyl-D-alanine carboxypeptidase
MGRAYGASNLEHQTNMEVCTPFRTESVTKIFTAVIIMQLYDEGKINLSSTASSGIAFNLE